MARGSSLTPTSRHAATTSSVVPERDTRIVAHRHRAPSTSHTFRWRHLTLRAKHAPNYINEGWSHVELFVVAPKAAPCPLTATGYFSHFLDEQHLITAGGLVPFFITWLDRQATTKQWAKTEAKWRQFDLFR